MHSGNYDSAETLHKIHTLHKRVAIVGLAMLFVILLVQLFWVVLYVQFSLDVKEIFGAPPPQSSGGQGFKTLDQLNAERPAVPKKFD